MPATSIQTTFKLLAKAVQLLRGVLQQSVTMVMLSLSAKPKEIRRPQARPNAPIKLPISSASKP